MHSATSHSNPGLPRTDRRRRQPVRRIGWFLSLVILPLGLGASPIRADSELETQAAFLVNFAKFVEWPHSAFPDDQSPFVFGFASDEPLGEVVTALIAQEQVKGRRVEVRRYLAGENPPACHLLFVSSAQSNRMEGLARAAQARSILTVGNTDGFLDQGGMVGFVCVGKSVRFDIHKQPLQRAQLAISSRLLALARAVRE